MEGLFRGSCVPIGKELTSTGTTLYPSLSLSLTLMQGERRCFTKAVQSFNCKSLPKFEGLQFWSKIKCKGNGGLIHDGWHEKSMVTDPAAMSSAAYDPPDNYLIDCGSLTNNIIDSRIFLADTSSSWSLSALQTTVANTTSPSLTSVDASVLYMTARIFNSVSSYMFPIKRKGRHFIRLYFFPFLCNNGDLSIANFSVSAQEVTLLSNFRTLKDVNVFKEYSINVTSDMLTLSFKPAMYSIAFINAIEVVSAPDNLVGDTARSLTSADPYQGLSGMVLESAYRINMGGPKVFPSSDSLGRTWVPDVDFLVDKNAAKNITSSGVLNWIAGGATNETAPETVYRSLTEMANVNVTMPIFNVSWEFSVDTSFTYLVRMHFCDFVSSTRNSFLFNVYIGSSFAAHDLDLKQLSFNTLAAPYYIDVITEVTVGSGKLRVSIGPTTSATRMSVETNAILNGLEIMKIASSFQNLHDTTVSIATSQSSSNTKLIVILAIVFGSIALLLLIAISLVVLLRRKTTKQSQSETVVSSIIGSASNTFGSNYSDGTLGSIASRNIDLGYFIPFVVLQNATNQFHQNCVIGNGGFGKVYKGVLKDNIVVAVKRANPDSQQGINEFHAEIQLLSQLRHKHLVSLIGYCDEGTEMILVYEYMENGSLKSNLYGSNKPSLSWKKRLEICIGAARGLHYLHTGLRRAVIHRDVKSANILLDENFAAKVADFGLSKTGTDLGETHLTTNVKGSFGYLDPEYFKRQKLTKKSDVYSFGVVLVEILCARPVIDPTRSRREINLVEWAMNQHKKGKLNDIVDTHLVGTILPESLNKFVETAMNCLMEDGKDRPSMSDVLWNLECVLQLEESLSSSGLVENSSAHITDLPPEVQYSRSTKNTIIQEVGESSQVQEQDGSYAAMSKIFSQLVNSKGR